MSCPTKLLAACGLIFWLNILIFGQCGWTEIPRGGAAIGFEYGREGAIKYKGAHLGFCNSPAGDSTNVVLKVSPLTPKKKLLLIVCWDGDSGGIEGYVVDTLSKQIISEDVVPKHWTIVDSVSWSGDERYGLVAAAGEVTDGDMASFDLLSRTVTEIHFRKIKTSDHELQDFDFEDLTWLSPMTFQVKLDVHCNPFENDDGKCDYKKIIRSQFAQISCSTGKIAYGQRQAAKITRARSIHRTDSVSSHNDELLSGANVWNLGVGDDLWRKMHESCGGSGGFWSWTTSAKKLGIKEQRSRNSFTSCIARRMKNAGAPIGAIDFAKEVFGEYYMGEFRETGRVDVALVVAPIWNDPDTSEWVLVNGAKRFVTVWDKLSDIDISSDPTYPIIARTFPNVEVWPQFNFENSETLPEGGQRFIFRFLLLNGCHACDIAGSARYALDFDGSGVFIGARLLGLESRN